MIKIAEFLQQAGKFDDKDFKKALEIYKMYIPQKTRGTKTNYQMAERNTKSYLKTFKKISQHKKVQNIKLYNLSFPDSIDYKFKGNIDIVLTENITPELKVEIEKLYDNTLLEKGKNILTRTFSA